MKRSNRWPANVRTAEFLFWQYHRAPTDVPPGITWNRAGYDARRTCRLCAVAEKPAAQKGPFPYALSRMFRNAKAIPSLFAAYHPWRGRATFIVILPCGNERRDAEKENRNSKTGRNAETSKRDASQHHNTSQHLRCSIQQRKHRAKERW